MTVLIIILHIVVCVALIMIVLLQTGKGADMGAAFGGGGSQTLFGSSGAGGFLSKATTVAAIVFMLTSLTLAYISGRRPGVESIVTDAKPPIESSQQTGAQPAPDTAAPAETQPEQPPKSE